MDQVLKNIINEIFKCKHKNAVLNSNEGYCPDCGKYLKKSYYIVRCSCCGIKRKAKRTFKEIMPYDKFCMNCGESKFTIEECEKLNLVDIDYAIEVKEEIEVNPEDKIEIWVDDKNEEVSVDEPHILPHEVKYIGVNL